MKTIIEATYSQTGHHMYPEDTWKYSMEVTNVKELFNFMKEMHKDSSRSFNDYPYNGLFSPSLEYNSCLETEIDGKIFRTKFEYSEPPEFEQEAINMYNQWYDFIKLRLPGLRKAYDNRIQKEKELRLLEKLTEKYK